jgi:hypothetical protein
MELRNQTYLNHSRESWFCTMNLDLGHVIVKGSYGKNISVSDRIITDSL